jgi:AraC-like DNA-binding protein
VKLAVTADLRVDHTDWGEESRTLIVRASDEDRRNWVTDSPLAHQLSLRNIANVGITWAKPSFKLFQPDPGGTFFVASFGSSGIITHHESSKTIDEGQACLLPRHLPNRIRNEGNRQWTYAFVRYLEPDGVIPVAMVESPEVGTYDASPLVQAIWGLHAEASGAAIPAAMQLWVGLINHYVTQFSHRHRQDERVWKVWEKIGVDLGRRWTLEEIAAEGNMSSEHFRRLCQDSIGQSPMRHLGTLRMQRASELLASTDLTIDAIASDVGYEFASTFSNAFLAWSGVRPSEFTSRGSRASHCVRRHRPGG